MRRAFSFVGAVVLVLALAPSARATSGTWTITTDTTLTEDHYGSIVIAASNVTLDCDGYTITGPAEPGAWDSGVFVQYQSAVTIRDCRATGFTQGIEVADSDGVSVLGNEAFANAGHGFFVVRSSSTRLVGNRSTGNGTVYPAAGFTFDESTASIVTNNVASGNDGGVWLHWAHENTFEGNTLDGNAEGLGADGSENNTFVSNSFSNNDGNGIGTIYSHSNTFRANVIAANGVDGILLDMSSYNRLVRNTVSDSTEHGIAVNWSYKTTLRANRVTRSGNAGIAFLGSSNALLSRNFVRGNLMGLLLDSAWGNVVADNQFIENGPNEGVLLRDSAENRFVDNVSRGNKYDGFGLFHSFRNQFFGNLAKRNRSQGFVFNAGSDNNLFSDNVATRNKHNGFGLFASSYNSLTDNSSTLNGYAGFEVTQGSSHNDLSHNYACGNVVDAQDDQTGTGNVWNGNTFCTSNI